MKDPLEDDRRNSNMQCTFYNVNVSARYSNGIGLTQRNVPVMRGHMLSVGEVSSVCNSGGSATQKKYQYVEG